LGAIDFSGATPIYARERFGPLLAFLPSVLPAFGVLGSSLAEFVGVKAEGFLVNEKNTVLPSRFICLGFPTERH